MPLKGGTRCILVFHHRGKHQRGSERDRKGVRDGLVVLPERVLEHVELKSPVKIPEKGFPQVRRLRDDNGTLRAEIAQAREGGSKHGVSRDKRVRLFAVKMF